MPVILEDEALDTWLDQSITDPARLQPLLATSPDDTVYAQRISSLVNDVKNDGPELLVTPPEIALLL